MKKIRTDIKRKLIQLAAFGFTNTRLANVPKGSIYTGKWKRFCTPGLNCYSCPAAAYACPIGAMQAVAGSMNYSFSFYVVGFVLAAGVLFGRLICGYVCPFGLVQEFFGIVPVKKRRLPKWMTYIKYAVLAVFVLLLPAVAVNYMGIGKPAFCQYICPAGTLEGGLPLLGTHPELRQALGQGFVLKAAVLALVLAGCIVVYRFFCKTLCPLGAIYGILNKISFCQMTVDTHKCVGCGRCAAVCRMDVDPVKECDSAECIRCGRCVESCPAGAIRIGFGGERKEKNEAGNYI